MMYIIRTVDCGPSASYRAGARSRAYLQSNIIIIVVGAAAGIYDGYYLSRHIWHVRRLWRRVDEK